jgi:hypothetical protein
MASCEFLNSCVFCIKQPTDMPHTMKYLKNLYCKGARYTECAIYRYSKCHGIERAPKYLYPNDVYDILDLNMIEPDGGLDMPIKVIYTAGTPGKVKSSALEGLNKMGEIIAYHCPEGWIDVRRTINSKQSGADRRRTNPETFFAGFSSD